MLDPGCQAAALVCRQPRPGLQGSYAVEGYADRDGDGPSIWTVLAFGRPGHRAGYEEDDELEREVWYFGVTKLRECEATYYILPLSRFVLRGKNIIIRFNPANLMAASCRPPDTASCPTPHSQFDHLS